ncbi:MAG: hypothetical protein ACYTBJ_01690 [Planctomycetota bacterium]|jgi:hypothetical protein
MGRYHREWHFGGLRIGRVPTYTSITYRGLVVELCSRHPMWKSWTGWHYSHVPTWNIRLALGVFRYVVVFWWMFRWHPSCL